VEVTDNTLSLKIDVQPKVTLNILPTSNLLTFWFLRVYLLALTLLHNMQ